MVRTSSSSSIVGFESISMDFDEVNDDAWACGIFGFILCDANVSMERGWGRLQR